ncbi:hypothetical protein Agub_g9057 [Astrephomene gubernaculifera]|uniref:Uncharacterized protein n=1 Tax=Astrephomene gubernaculifera TaxID=47775 RepID=A0AAD3DVD0_9CHLO|nr:hypothetical protein Agub_g9057 [Astrephomene gubernaculifera]
MFGLRHAVQGGSLSQPPNMEGPVAFGVGSVTAMVDRNAVGEDCDHLRSDKRARMELGIGHGAIHAPDGIDCATDGASACITPPNKYSCGAPPSGSVHNDPHGHYPQPQAPCAPWEKPPPLVATQGSGQYSLKTVGSSCRSTAVASSSAPSPNPAPPAGALHQQPSQDMLLTSPSAVPWRHCDSGLQASREGLAPVACGCGDSAAARCMQPHVGSVPNGGSTPETSLAGGQSTGAAAPWELGTSSSGTEAVVTPTVVRCPHLVVPLPPITTGLPEQQHREVAAGAVVADSRSAAVAACAAAQGKQQLAGTDADTGYGYSRSVGLFDYASMWKGACEALESVPSLAAAACTPAAHQELPGSGSGLMTCRSSQKLQRQQSNIITTGNSIEPGPPLLLHCGSGRTLASPRAAAAHHVPGACGMPAAAGATASAPAAQAPGMSAALNKVLQAPLRKYGSGINPNAVTTGAGPSPAEMCVPALAFSARQECREGHLADHGVGEERRQHRRRAGEVEPGSPAELADDAISSCGSKDDFRAASPGALSPAAFSSQQHEQHQRPFASAHSMLAPPCSTLTTQLKAGPSAQFLTASQSAVPDDSATLAAPTGCVPHPTSAQALQPSNPCPQPMEADAAVVDADIDEAAAALLEAQEDGDAWWEGPADLEQEWQHVGDAFMEPPAATVNNAAPALDHTSPAADCSAASNGVVACPGGNAAHPSAGTPDSDAAASFCTAAKHANTAQLEALGSSLPPSAPLEMAAPAFAALCPTASALLRSGQAVEPPVDGQNVRLTASYWDEMEPTYGEPQEAPQQPQQPQEMGVGGSVAGPSRLPHQLPPQWPSGHTAGPSVPLQEQQAAQVPQPAHELAPSRPQPQQPQQQQVTDKQATAWPVRQAPSTCESASHAAQPAGQDPPQAYLAQQGGGKRQFCGEGSGYAQGVGWAPAGDAGMARTCERYGAVPPSCQGWGQAPMGSVEQRLQQEVQKPHQRHQQQVGMQGWRGPGSPAHAMTEATAYCNGHKRHKTADVHDWDGIMEDVSDISSRRSSYGSGNGAAHRSLQHLQGPHLQAQQQEAQQQYYAQEQYPASRQLQTFESFESSNDLQAPYVGALTCADQPSHGCCPPGQAGSVQPWQPHAPSATPQPLCACDCEACRAALVSGPAAARPAAVGVPEPRPRSLSTGGSGNTLMYGRCDCPDCNRAYEPSTSGGSAPMSYAPYGSQPRHGTLAAGASTALPPSGVAAFPAMQGHSSCPCDMCRRAATSCHPPATTYRAAAGHTMPPHPSGYTQSGLPMARSAPELAQPAPLQYAAQAAYGKSAPGIHNHLQLAAEPSSGPCKCSACISGAMGDALHAPAGCSVPPAPLPAAGDGYRAAVPGPLVPYGHAPVLAGAPVCSTGTTAACAQEGNQPTAPLSRHPSMECPAPPAPTHMACAPQLHAFTQPQPAQPYPAYGTHLQAYTGGGVRLRRSSASNAPAAATQFGAVAASQAWAAVPPPMLYRSATPAPSEGPCGHPLGPPSHFLQAPAQQQLPQGPQLQRLYSNGGLARQHSLPPPPFGAAAGSGCGAPGQVAPQASSVPAWAGAPCDASGNGAADMACYQVHDVATNPAGGGTNTGMQPQGVEAGLAASALQRMCSSELLPPSYSAPPPPAGATCGPWQQQQQQVAPAPYSAGSGLAAQADLSSAQPPHLCVQANRQGMSSVADEEAMWVEHPFMSWPKRGNRLP